MSPAVQPLGAAELGELLAELRPLVLGWRVKEVAPEPPHGLMLVLERDGEPHVRRLRLAADPDAPRVHLVQGRSTRHQGSVGPFFAQLPKAFVGATLARIEQPKGDRIVLLAFGPDATPPRAALLGELTGRHANLALLDGSERVLALLVEAPAKAGATPRLVRGAPWQPPPGSPPKAAGRLVDRLPEPAELPRGTLLAPLSWRVECSLGGAALAVDRERAQRDLEKRLTRRLGKARGLVQGLAAREEAAQGAERWQQDGELLKASLGSLIRGMKQIEVADWFAGGEPRTIALDPKLSPRENLERIFERAKKLERSKDAIARERELALARVAALEDCIARLGSDDADPAAIEREAVEAGLVEALGEVRGKKVQTKAPRLCYKRFAATSGADVLVGRSAKDNDELTFRVARGNDLWLHTADSPGSHVVLRVERGAEPHPEDLLDAAHLALHFSPLAGARRASIHIAARKLVHKPKGAPAGLVTLSGGRTLEIRLEPARLERLLGSDRGAAGPSQP
ncbi:MAG: DUF814 domain-containing protein [Planctomycetaceae bacterium]|nr:DUF814 domain-containing protein [Planctomycetaceae bacterium]